MRKSCERSASSVRRSSSVRRRASTCAWIIPAMSLTARPRRPTSSSRSTEMRRSWFPSLMLGTVAAPGDHGPRRSGETDGGRRRCDRPAREARDLRRALEPEARRDVQRARRHGSQGSRRIRLAHPRRYRRLLSRPLGRVDRAEPTCRCDTSSCAREPRSSRFPITWSVTKNTSGADETAAAITDCPDGVRRLGADPLHAVSRMAYRDPSNEIWNEDTGGAT